jgi:hypothetical protein
MKRKPQTFRLFQRSETFFFTLLLLLSLAPRQASHAHSEHSRVRGVSVLAGEDSDTDERVYGGYGYLAESEAEAYERLQFGCSEENLAAYQATACQSPATGSAPTRAQAEAALLPLVIQDLQRHEAEYLIFQANALGTRLSPLPDCLRPDPALERLPSSLPSALPRNASLRALPEAERETLNRYRATASPLLSDEMLRALLFDDQIRTNLRTYCRGDVGPYATSFCTDLRNNQDRLQRSFPALFSSAAGSLRDSLRSATQELLGARFPEARTSEARIRRGRALYEQGISAGAGADALSELETRISSAILDSARAPEGREGTAPSEERSALQGAVSRMNEAFRGLRAGQLSRVQADFAALCSRSNLEETLQRNPNLVRQMLSDASPERRAAAQLLLCGTAALRSVRTRTTCEGVARDPRTGNVRVRRDDWSFPYVSSLNYQITPPRRPPADAPTEISTTVAIRADSGLDPAEVSTMLARMGEQTNGYFNCMSGQNRELRGVPGLSDRSTCPPRPEMADPPVRFNIQFVQTPPAPAVQPIVALHRCYNAELAGAARTDCNAIRDHAITQCRETIELWQRQGRVGGSARYAPDIQELIDNLALEPRARTASPSPAPDSAAPASTSAAPDYLRMSPSEISTHCDRENPPSSTGAYDREDSGNYTFNTAAGTVLHEVGHAMGLPDEYQDPNYSFLPQGEHDSIMNNSGNPNASITPRHLSRILSPAACGSGRRSSATRGAR